MRKNIFKKKKRFAGILSAYGMGLADVVFEAQEACASLLTPDKFDYLQVFFLYLGRIGLFIHVYTGIYIYSCVSFSSVHHPTADFFFAAPCPNNFSYCYFV